jgi:phenylalanyl-tRNA synthetase beta chain
LELKHKKFAAKRISRYPIVERDLAIVVDESITVGDIKLTIKQCIGNNFYSLKLFDIYRNKEQLGNKKSLAFRIRLQSDEKTLSEEDINKVIDRILKRTNQLYGATLR